MARPSIHRFRAEMPLRGILLGLSELHPGVRARGLVLQLEVRRLLEAEHPGDHARREGLALHVQVAHVAVVEAQRALHAALDMLERGAALSQRWEARLGQPVTLHVGVHTGPVVVTERGDVFGLRRWYVITLLMGTFFVLGQGYEYIHLVTHGTTIPASAYGSVFYLATGFHGLHVIGGLIAFVLLLARTAMSKFTPAQATAAIVVSYYWHFVDIVWIALFATIYFVR